jgi:hypothetical protein
MEEDEKGGREEWKKLRRVIGKECLGKSHWERVVRKESLGKSYWERVTVCESFAPEGLNIVSPG